MEKRSGDLEGEKKAGLEREKIRLGGGEKRLKGQFHEMFDMFFY